MLLYLFCFLSAAALLAADQWTKFWVESHMALEEVRPLLPPALELHAVHNYGAAWSLFAGARWVLVGVTGFMMLAVALALCLRLVRHPLGVFSASLILTGGVGNLLDRIFQGYVVDMLRFPFWTAYPTFNVADICVVSGCLLWLLYVLFVREDGAAEPAKAAETAKTDDTADTAETAKTAEARSDRLPAERPSGGGWEFGPGSDTETDTGPDKAENQAEPVQNADRTQRTPGVLRNADSGQGNAGIPQKADSGQKNAEPVNVRQERRPEQNQAQNQAQRQEQHQEKPVRQEKKEEIRLPPVPPVLLSYAGRSEQAAAPERVTKVLGESGNPPSPHTPRAYDPSILGGSPWKALLEEEDQAEARAKKADGGSRDWDSAESFFGGTPFRMSDKNGRVWP